MTKCAHRWELGRIILDLAHNISREYVCCVCGGLGRKVTKPDAVRANTDAKTSKADNEANVKK